MYYRSVKNRRKPVRTRRVRRVRKKVYVKRRYPLKRYVSALPQRMFVKLNYCEPNMDMSLAAAVVSTQTWRLNSLFDPDLTGVGHQPYLYDQYSALFNRFLVHGCKVYVAAQLQSGAARPACIFFDANSNNSGLVGVDPRVDAEFFNNKTVVVPTDQSLRYMKKYYSIARVMNVTRLQYKTDPNYLGLTGNAGVGADPSKPALGIFYAYSNTACTLSYYIRLTFYVEFFERHVNVIS